MCFVVLLFLSTLLQSPSARGDDNATENDLRRWRLGLSDSDPEVRARTAKILGDIGPSAKRAVPMLIPVALKDPIKEVRANAVFALAFIGAVNDQVIPCLITALKDKDAEVRLKALGAISNIGPDARSAVPALVELLKSKTPSPERSAVPYALARIGPDARAAIPILLDILAGHPDHELEGAVTIPLGDIRSRETLVVPALIDALTDNNRKYLRVGAAYALGQFGEKAKAAVPGLIQALDVSHIREPRMAVHGQIIVLDSIGKIGVHAQEAATALHKLMQEPSLDPQVRERAKNTLELIRPAHP